MAHLYLFVFLAILLCTAQLCLGLWIGAKFGRIQEQRRSSQRRGTCRSAPGCWRRRYSMGGESDPH